MSAPAPIAMLAELTHRCPLSCAYCSNPLELDGRAQELSTEQWGSVFAQAAALGVVQLHLSGGEPLTRRDLPDLVGLAAEAGLYTNLITSGIGLTHERAQALASRGLDHVQLSFQDTDADQADRFSGLKESLPRKRSAAEAVVGAGLPLTMNVVLHRGNVARLRDFAAEALRIGAQRLELAHTQLYGWAARNRAALLPDRVQVVAARDEVRALTAELRGQLTIDYVPSDHHARYPKPCMNGWGRQSLNVTPSGLVMPCHGAYVIPGLAFWNVRDRTLAEIWANSPAFEAYRGTDWMREPCRSCERREVDFGGCRCQAMALTGDARNTDPVCVLSPSRGVVDAVIAEDRVTDFVPRAQAP